MLFLSQDQAYADLIRKISEKTNCQKAVEIALADTKGEIKNVALGPLQAGSCP